MVVSRVEKLQGVLDELSMNPEIVGSAVVSEDGLIIASSLPSELDEERVSAVVAALQSIAERSTHQIGLGRINRLMVFAERGGVLLYVGEKASLAVFTRPSAKLGLILLETAEAVKSLKEFLG